MRPAFALDASKGERAERFKLTANTSTNTFRAEQRCSRWQNGRSHVRMARAHRQYFTDGLCGDTAL